ncbi:MAG: ATP-binding protein [Candidatus Tectomicrobia bacterium]|nr:ATP-binding protein [Candidatus Tectomicrobia bacterium]
MLVLIVALLFIVESRYRGSIVAQMKKRGVAGATQLAAVSRDSLLTYNFVALEQDAEQLSRDPDILYAIILDRDGRVATYSGDDGKQGTVLTDPVSQKAAAVARGALIQYVERHLDQPEHYDIAVPVHVAGDNWGTVRLGLSLEEMRAEIRRTRIQVLLLGVLGLALSTLAAAFLARRISAPIQALTEGTMAVARGEDLPPIEVHTRDEIAVLASNFNHMMSELSKHRAALDQKVQELSILANYNRNVLTSMTSGLFTLDLDGCFETCNAMAATLMGWSTAEIQGQHYREVLASHPQFKQVIETSHRHRTPLTVPRLELEWTDGKRMPLGLRTAMLHDRDGNSVIGLLATFEDLSSMQALERQLRRADRMANLGTVAAGLAHEVKNPLTSVRAFVQLVRQKHDDRNFMEQFDRIVLHEVDRINNIVEELLDLTRPAPLHRVPMDLLELLQRVTDTYAEQMRQQNVTLAVDWPDVLAPLEADTEQLHRVFGNITLNALEAMPEGGTLHVTCRAIPRSLGHMISPGYEKLINTANLDQDHYATDIEVVVRDTGVGIPADQLDALFTPFYTTKKRGTGLGLALTHKIIEEHGGRIHITSDVGQGTAVTVILPSSALSPDPQSAAPSDA